MLNTVIDFQIEILLKVYYGIFTLTTTIGNSQYVKKGFKLLSFSIISVIYHKGSLLHSVFRKKSEKVRFFKVGTLNSKIFKCSVMSEAF